MCKKKGSGCQGQAEATDKIKVGGRGSRKANDAGQMEDRIVETENVARPRAQGKESPTQQWRQEAGPKGHRRSAGIIAKTRRVSPRSVGKRHTNTRKK
jgi:hypothetical protein